jgi:phosphoribosylformylglycinamidine cyclo-ligase
VSGAVRPGVTYAHAGVDVEGERAALAGLIAWVRKTQALRPAGAAGHMALDVGYFASVVELPGGVGLAVSADGVGTKLLVAQLAGRYDTVGIDLVAMNVNDLICVGAEPIALLDYVAIERLDGPMLEAIGKGLHDGAVQANCVIAGGELAQIGAMLRGAVPGKAFDLAAVAVGLVPLDRVNVGAAVRPGDVVVGLASSGIHSNGLSLARGALLERAGLALDDPLPGDPRQTVGQALLEPTRIYVKPVLELLRDPAVEVTALANITGGGFRNLARVRARCGYVLDALPPVPAVFRAIQAAGQVAPADMYHAYNMGVGFCVTVRPAGAARVVEVARAHGIEAWPLGRAIDSPERRISLPAVGLDWSHAEGFKEARP